MGYVTNLLQYCQRFDMICVIVDMMTKSIYFFLVITNFSTKDYAMLLIEEIMNLNCTPVSIISN